MQPDGKSMLTRTQEARLDVVEGSNMGVPCISLGKKPYRLLVYPDPSPSTLC